MNPFSNRTTSLSDPARDLEPVTPSDAAALPNVAVALYIETGGTLTFETVAGSVRTINVVDAMLLPVGAVSVHATGTTAQGIHAFIN